MQCIFCKADSSYSKTIEHIIPEALGNTEHTLPPGIVCDKCNNYFAREVEKPVLDTPYFVYARHHKLIANKRGNVPTVKGIHLNSATIIEISNDADGTGMFASAEKDNARFIQTIRQQKRQTIALPIPDEPANNLMARFIGKIALEVLAQKLLRVPGGIDEIVNKREFDELRHFVRIGGRNRDWLIHKRRIYADDFVFYEQGYGYYEVLHEYDLLYTEGREIYLVIALLGMEYAINMGGSEINGYVTWLESHNNISPLYAK